MQPLSRNNWIVLRHWTELTAARAEVSEDWSTGLEGEPSRRDEIPRLKVEVGRTGGEGLQEGSGHRKQKSDTRDS